MGCDWVGIEKVSISSLSVAVYPLSAFLESSAARPCLSRDVTVSARS